MPAKGEGPLPDGAVDYTASSGKQVKAADIDLLVRALSIWASCTTP